MKIKELTQWFPEALIQTAFKIMLCYSIELLPKWDLKTHRLLQLTDLTKASLWNGQWLIQSLHTGQNVENRQLWSAQSQLNTLPQKGSGNLMEWGQKYCKSQRAGRSEAK